jgi:adenylate kinase
MRKLVMLITGTPCVGKTTVAHHLATELKAKYINLNELAKKHDLILSEDKKRKTSIIDEEKTQEKIEEIITKTKKHAIVIDGHYAPAVVPKHLVTHIFLLRRNPIELRIFMEKKGFTGRKLWENLASEILDVCLVEALREHEKEKVCEIDVTYRSTDEIICEIIAIKEKTKKCRAGWIDWLGLLEEKKILGQYLKI